MTPGRPVAAHVVAVCVAHDVIDIPQRGARSAIDKRPVPGPVRVHRLGLAGDRQVDTEHHGGLEQAVYAYAHEETQRWTGELGRSIPPGLFGENLSVAGVPTTDAVIGERWRVGTAEFEVTLPRIPCYKFAHVMGEPQWIKRFSRRGDVGTYLRVVAEGSIRAGDEIEVTHRPAHGLTVRTLFRAGLGIRPGDLTPVRAALAGPDALPGKAIPVLRQYLDSAEPLVDGQARPAQP